MKSRIGVWGVVASVAGAAAAGLGANGYHEMSAGLAASTVVGEKPGQCCDDDFTPAENCLLLAPFQCVTPGPNGIQCVNGEGHQVKPKQAGCKGYKSENAQCLTITTATPLRLCVANGQDEPCRFIGDDPGMPPTGKRCLWSPFQHPTETVPQITCGTGSTLCYCHFILGLDLPPSTQDELFRLCEEIENELGL